MKSINLKNKERINVGKIVCVGRNYAEHAKELGNEVPAEPILFLKPASAMIYSGEKIIHPSFSKDLHHEIELVLLIGTKTKDCTLEEAGDAISGYGVGLDMTARDVQATLKKEGKPWTLAKCFDTSAVISDFISKDDYHLDLNETITLKVNGEVRQSEKLNMMIFSPAELVRYISSVMTLEEGDLVYTGTPAGVSKVEVGDKLEGNITGIGTIEAEIV
jgi:5-carboxymethyl-2-hydroxymuconate isomerase